MGFPLIRIHVSLLMPRLPSIIQQMAKEGFGQASLYSIQAHSIQSAKLGLAIRTAVVDEATSMRVPVGCYAGKATWGVGMASAPSMRVAPLEARGAVVRVLAYSVGVLHTCADASHGVYTRW